MKYKTAIFGGGWVWLILFITGIPVVYAQEQAPRDLFVTVGKSIVIDSPVTVERVSVATPDYAEAVAVKPREILINGKAPGETSLVIWQQGGNRLLFDLHVRPSSLRMEAIQREMDKEVGKGVVTITQEDPNVFLRGTVENLTAAERAVAIATTLGKPVNLLHVKVPGAEPQFLLKVRFANLDRAATQELGANLFSLNKGGIGQVTTQQFSPLQPGQFNQTQNEFRITDLLNIFLLNRDLDIGATIKALESKRVLQVLAEPNVLATNGKPASFLAGGEFPYPTLQGGGGGLGAVTIQFREFGVRIHFVPNLTPRGTLRMLVTPEVSSLDFANGLVFQGFTIPGLNTRRVSTEVELEQGQSFAIGGLLDNRVTEAMSKIPGLGDIPFLGKLFRSRLLQKNNTELLVLVTPELVRPIPANQPLPDVQMPKEPLKDTAKTAPRTPGIDKTGPVPTNPQKLTIPVEDMVQSEKGKMSPGTAAPAPVQYVPIMPVTPLQQSAPPPTTPPPSLPKQPAAGSGANPGGQ
ncbi:MAG TPA: pilus assembly protein N-terminal domain-containing protein [Bryobacteraceae bacterium]|nr:pilus assembly protein N-terminal domain-containing protein [Bryobacteraceae bacterium]